MKESFYREKALWAGIALLGGITLAGQVALAFRSSAPAREAHLMAQAASGVPAEPEAGPVFSEQRRAELLVEAIVQVESGGNPRCVGRAGERGLMQIKKATWKQISRKVYGHSLDFDQAFNPRLNRRVGAAYLKQLQAFLQPYRPRWKTDERSLLLACYNAGPGAVLRAGFDPKRLPASTRSYVSRASALHTFLEQYEKGLVQTASRKNPASS